MTSCSLGNAAKQRSVYGGPIKLMSPRSTFINCGNSFNFVFLRITDRQHSRSFFNVIVPVPISTVFNHGLNFKTFSSFLYIPRLNIKYFSFSVNFNTSIKVMKMMPKQ